MRRTTTIASALALLLSILAVAPAAAAGTVTPLTDPSLEPADLAEQLAGVGVTVSNVSFTGDERAAGTFVGAEAVIGFDDGVILSSGQAVDVEGPNESGSTTTNLGQPGDVDLTALAGFQTYDATILEFDFVPDGDTVFFEYVFGSEEYNEYVGTSFNDVFAFWVNGENCALVGDPAVPVTINTINNGTNSALYVDNTGGTRHTEMDGFTVPLTCEAAVNDGVTNSMRLAIADAGDSALDSWVLIQAGSLTTDPDPDPDPDPDLPAGAIPWTGHGSDHLPCEGGYHWIFSPGGGVTNVTFHSSAGSAPMEQKGASGSGAWHYDSGLVTLQEGVTPYVTFDGTAHGSAALRISNCLDGDDPIELEGEITVEKTADTSYDRAHDWAIDKSVDPGDVDLYVDGSGDTLVEWTVDVDYLGYEDTDIEVSGLITIANTGDFAAEIHSIDDVISPSDTAADVTCEVEGAPITYPYTLETETELDCTYLAGLDAVEDGINTVTVEGFFLDPDDTAFDESDTATVVFGDPDNDAYVEVDIEDLSELLGYQLLGTLHAYDDFGGVAGSDTFTYDHLVTWEDHAEDCANSPLQVDNTATVTDTETEDVIDEDDASLVVRVQCLVFEGETAWAANGDAPGELRYNTRGNWATFVHYTGPKTTTLFAGQHIDVGDVTFSAVSDGEVTITVTLDGDWEFEAMSENLKVQDYDKAPSGNPAPGKFKHKKTCDVASNTCSIQVPSNTYYGVHVNVGTWVPDPNF